MTSESASAGPAYSGSPQLTLTARLNLSAAEARRGIVRVHPEVLAGLALREWDGVAVIGSRTTTAVIAATASSEPTGIALLDELTLSNAGIKPDAPVVLAPAVVHGATRIVVRGSSLTKESVDERTFATGPARQGASRSAMWSRYSPATSAPTSPPLKPPASWHGRSASPGPTNS